MKHGKFKIESMTCAVCSGVCEKAILKLEGIESASVNLLSETALVMYDEQKVSDGDIIAAVTAAGYPCRVYDEQAEYKNSSQRKARELKLQRIKLTLSLIFTIPLFYLTMAPMITFIKLPYPSFFAGEMNAVPLTIAQIILTVPVVIIGYRFYLKGFYNLFNLKPNMDSLVAIGTMSAFLYSVYGAFRVFYGDHHFVHNLYFESTAVIITLILLGKYLEASSKGKTAEAIRMLMDLTPKTALVFRNGEELEVDVSEVMIDDVIVVKPGSSMPVDGVVIAGSTTVDESMLTGESMPVDKAQGDRVFAATINKNGTIRYRAEKIGADTALSQIVRLVQDAAGTKAPIARLADKVSGYFVPVVIVIAAISATLWFFNGRGAEFSLTIFISVLVISCPCALGLATPTAIIVATGQGASKGILYKNATALQKVGKITTAVFDKTGTITEGKPGVTDVILLSENKNYSKTSLIQYAASAEVGSEHPLGAAIVRYAHNSSIELYECKNFNSVTGFGVECDINEKRILVGKAEHVGYDKVNDTTSSLAKQGKTPIYLSIDGEVVGVIAVADIIRGSSGNAVKMLGQRGIKSTMLTGDNHTTATAIATKAGIDTVFAEVLPHEKAAVVQKLQQQGECVLMVGDGINDAPALVTADVGMAIGNGTDIAIESADIILVRSDIMDVCTAVDLSHLTMKNIKQNLFFSFIYNVLGIPVACGVLYLFGGPLLNPMIAAAAMSLSSVCVVLNALRIKVIANKK